MLKILNYECKHWYHETAKTSAFKIAVGWFHEYVTVTAFELAKNTELLHKLPAGNGTFIQHPTHFDENHFFTQTNNDHPRVLLTAKTYWLEAWIYYQLILLFLVGVSGASYKSPTQSA